MNKIRVTWKTKLLILLVTLVALFGTFQGYWLVQNYVIAESRIIKVVMDDNFPPYVFRDAEGKLGGILIDQWVLWEKKTGGKVHISAMDWAVAQKEMQEKKHNVIDTIFKNPERDKLYDFSKPYVQLETVVFFNKNLSGITDLKSLKGFNVGVKSGDHAISVLAKSGISGIIEYNSYESMILAARDSNLLIFIMEKQPGLYFLHKHGLIDQVRFTDPLYHGEFHRAVGKGDNETLRLVEAGFALFSRADHLAIERKWFGTASRESGFDFKQLATILAAGIFFSATLIVWNWTLRRTVRRKTADLASSEKKYRDLLMNLAIGVIVYGKSGKPNLWNATAVKELGLIESQMMDNVQIPEGWEYLTVNGSKLDPAMFPGRIVRRTAEPLRHYGMGVRQPDGTERWFQVDAFPDFDNEGRIEQVVVTFSNVTAMRETEQRLMYISFHDALTGVYNRAYFEEELRRLEKRRSGPLTIAVMDVDGLKQINDKWGHSQGDLLLIRAAQILQQVVRSEDVVARIGGDEFVIILRNIDEPSVIKIFERLRKALDLEKHKSDQGALLSLSMGYAFVANLEISAIDLFKTADNQMYREKTQWQSESESCDK